MAALWPLSRTPQIDPNGDPYSGALAYFYNAGTTTLQTIYTDSDLAIPHDNPVEANANGAFPAVYLSPGSYRQRVTDADEVVLFDDDGIDVPQSSAYVPPEAGDTDETLLARTGDIKARYGTGAHSGWVRLNGRTIGSASSSATERANADCEDLFEFLWGADSNLSVSGGRGGSAASDWAANKTIALPSGRDRVLVGLGDMGNTDANLIADSLVDGGSGNTTLGATLGASTVALTVAQLAAHDHDGTTGTESTNHTHGIPYHSGSDSGGLSSTVRFSGDSLVNTIQSGTQSNTHTHDFTSDETGGGEAHPNLQPGIFVTWYVKL